MEGRAGRTESGAVPLSLMWTKEVGVIGLLMGDGVTLGEVMQGW